MSRVLLIITCLYSTVLLSGCPPAQPATPTSQLATPTPQPTVVPTQGPPPSPQVAPESGTPAATTAAAPTPEVSQGEAVQVVREYMEAVGNEDFQRMRELTVGQAAEETQKITSRFQEVQREREVPLDAQVKDFRVGEVRASDRQIVVETDSTIEIYANPGFLSFNVRTVRGDTRFYLARVNGEPRIVRIEGDYTQLSDMQ